MFSTCAADCGSVLGPCPKVIGTEPTVSVLTTSWPSAIVNGEPGGTSVRTTTLLKCLFGFIWVGLGGFEFIWAYLGLLGFSWVCLGLVGFGWVVLHLFRFIRV